MEDDKVSAVVGMVLEEKREIAVFEYNLISAMLDEAALYWSGSRRWRIWQSPQQNNASSGYGYHLRVYHL